MTQKEVLTRQIISKPIAKHEVTSQAPLSSSFASSGMSTWMMPLYANPASKADCVPTVGARYTAVRQARTGGLVVQRMRASALAMQFPT